MTLSTKTKRTKTHLKKVKKQEKKAASLGRKKGNLHDPRVKDVDLKSIKELIDFRTPIEEWAIPILRALQNKTDDANSNTKENSRASIIERKKDTSAGQLYSDFLNIFKNLNTFIKDGYTKEVVVMLPLFWLIAESHIRGWEKIIPEFGNLNLLDNFFIQCAKDVDRKRKNSTSPDPLKKSNYQDSCRHEMLKIVILQKSGWKKHWIRNTHFPVQPFGSDSGLKDWKVWMTNYLTELHNIGHLRANPNTKFSTKGKAKDRSNQRKQYFEKIYKEASKPLFELQIGLLHDSLNMEARIKSYPDDFSFLTLMAMAHPDCAPKGFVPQRIKLPE